MNWGLGGIGAGPWPGLPPCSMAVAGLPQLGALCGGG